MLIMDPTSYGSPIFAGDMNTIRIGKYCSIANSAMFDSGCQHNTNFVTTFPLWLHGAPENREGQCRRDITVGDDCGIGDGAFIMSGVTIGDGAVIGARAVVRHDVYPYEKYLGFREEKYERTFRFPFSIMDRLLVLKWWDWPQERILANAHLLLSENIEAFLEANEGIK